MSKTPSKEVIYFIYFLFLPQILTGFVFKDGLIKISRYKNIESSYSIVGLSFTECMEECAARQNCDGVNYNRRRLLCEITYEEYGFGGLGDLDSDSDGLVQIPGWVYGETQHSDMGENDVCACLPGEKCDIITPDNWLCMKTHCELPEAELSEYGVRGNIRTIGSRVLVYCSLPTLPELGGPYSTVYECNENGEWELVGHDLICVAGTEIFRGFKEKHGIKRAWDSSNSSTNATSCLNSTLQGSFSCDSHYRSNDLDIWDILNISRVLFTVNKNNRIVHYIVFNGTGSDSYSWFSHERIITTSWSDLKKSTPDIFSITGRTNENTTYFDNGHCYKSRRFVISKTYGDCLTDSGWFLTTMAKANRNMCCDYDKGYLLSLVYAENHVSVNWSQPTDIERADYMSVYIFTDD